MVQVVAVPNEFQTILCKLDTSMQQNAWSEV